VSRSLNILHTSELYAPSLGGSQEVLRQISERLVKKGHGVTVATSTLEERRFKELNGVEIEQFPLSGNYVNGMSGDLEKYRQFVKGSDNDIMLNYGAQTWPTDALLDSIKELPTYNILVPVGFSYLRNEAYSDYYSNMERWLTEYDACVYMSNTYQDIEFARACGAMNSVIIPNGADEREFEGEDRIDLRKKLGIPENDFLILLVGTHSGLKGHEEAMRILRQARIEKATLLIVANDHGRGCGNKCSVLMKMFQADLRNRLSRKKLIITELSRADTVAAYKSADLFLFPSNIECSPLVLFESMASGLPFMTTAVGNSVEIVDWSGG
jgi:glycosyltransferase involved in cell wall biosynthesis